MSEAKYPCIMETEQNYQELERLAGSYNIGVKQMLRGWVAEFLMRPAMTQKRFTELDCGRGRNGPAKPGAVRRTHQISVTKDLPSMVASFERAARKFDVHPDELLRYIIRVNLQG
ncbi:hypothetical protein [Pseudoxanthomonas winnipegensis]|uniref:Uncharacterized protein n=1 Tax=Pseudoxanthomonas winnipegensis TaxID=2480810 RepID=A0A4Q8M380_9GAMM|nr:hypothetical protein [Pseudoxanthomonas winnipegensis]TAA41561.1 hypothetical protein EA655_11505 [Pseudoxanthomonas winnipegensis]